MTMVIMRCFGDGDHKHKMMMAISYHNMPCKNKLDVLYFVCCKFYVAATG